MIVSSTFVVGPAQKDGRVWVSESHTDHLGVVHLFQWLASHGADHAAVCAARAPRISQALAESEFLEAIERETWSPVQHQTGTEFAARFRARYKDSSKVECAKLAKWLLDQIDAGNFTDAAVRTAFGMTTTQWNTLKTNKLTPLRTAYNAVLAAQGE